MQKIKHQLTSAPTLAHFGLTASMMVSCDASVVVLSAVLSQLHDGVEKAVAFASHSLTPAEQKYSVASELT